MGKLIIKGVLAFPTVLLFGISSQVLGQGRETLAKNPKLFVETAAKLLGWNDPAEPMKIVGPIYFVGTKGLGVWLIKTSEGHILLNTGMPSSGPMIEASIRKLGLKPEDVKLLLTCHAPIDHVGGHAYIKKIAGAQVAMIDAEKDLLQTGGKIDFHYGEHTECACNRDAHLLTGGPTSSGSGPCTRRLLGSAATGSLTRLSEAQRAVGSLARAIRGVFITFKSWGYGQALL